MQPDDDDFPPREQAHHSTLYPGLTFFFAHDPNWNTRQGRDWFPGMDRMGEEFDRGVPWTILQKVLSGNVAVGQWYSYLLLGPGPTVRWFEGSLGWIRRVAEPITRA